MIYRIVDFKPIQLTAREQATILKCVAAHLSSSSKCGFCTSRGYNAKQHALSIIYDRRYGVTVYA